MHPRQRIREEIQSLLIASAICGDSVFTDRAKKIHENDLPAIYIFSSTETSRYANEPDLTLERLPSIVVMALAIPEVNKGVDDVLDDMAQQIEDVLNPLYRHEGYWDRLELTGTEIEIDDSGSKRIGAVSLTYSLRYDSPQTFR